MAGSIIITIPEDTIRLNIKTLLGTTKQVICNKKETVAQLKEQIAFLMDIDKENQTLLFNNLTLEDEKDLDSYGLKDGDSLKLIIGVGNYQILEG